MPSVGCVVVPGSRGGFEKLFFGKEEIAIPSFGRWGRRIALMRRTWSRACRRMPMGAPRRCGRGRGARCCGACIQPQCHAPAPCTPAHAAWRRQPASTPKRTCSSTMLRTAGQPGVLGHTAAAGAHAGPACRGDQAGCIILHASPGRHPPQQGPPRDTPAPPLPLLPAECSAFESSMEALQQATIRVVVIIAGVAPPLR